MNWCGFSRHPCQGTLEMPPGLRWRKPTTRSSTASSRWPRISCGSSHPTEHGPAGHIQHMWVPFTSSSFSSSSMPTLPSLLSTALKRPLQRPTQTLLVTLVANASFIFSRFWSPHASFYPFPFLFGVNISH